MRSLSLSFFLLLSISYLPPCLSLQILASVVDSGSACEGERLHMSKRRRCPFCRRLFTPNPRLKERQKTCARQQCRQKQKCQCDEYWRLRHPEYFRGMYPHQKETYGSRAQYRKRYRKRNPEYVRRNALLLSKNAKRVGGKSNLNR
jgi:hypothetical protein